ncbi:hypothetical protein [Ralstonia flatus]|uniref:Uncharacterized protein n=1 Tax=Ralstonia flatus TaxID=3058601 RepID=A0AAD2F3X2_9RALS|nr:hypothetical protein [Ralstonia sp. LMG 32965]MBN6211196.1 hypothetical protein [Ralstonia pickettii]CAJ0859571.1 hypothetical protein R77567_01377 [Ralstonia sp. LMG 32965]CAJ0867625.1 hypothetical protein R77564_01394 [Ralstonia sp. LMG 32965]
MTTVIVNLANKENIHEAAVTIDKVRWGHNGHASLGQGHNVPAGTYTARIYSGGKELKTKEVTVPTAGPVTFNLSAD